MNDKNPTAGPWGFPKVPGFCPMGCGPTLFAAEGGYITCSLIGCPNPSAVSDLIAVNQPEHLVRFYDAGFEIIHPLRERLDPAAMLTCDLEQHVRDMLHRITPRPGINIARFAQIDPTSRLAGAATWFFDETHRDRWPIPETHTCSRCGDDYTGLWRDHLRTECSASNLDEPAPDPEPTVEPLLSPSEARR